MTPLRFRTRKAREAFWTRLQHRYEEETYKQAVRVVKGFGSRNVRMDADEAYNEGWLRVWEKLEATPTPPQEKPWIMSVTRNAGIDHGRRVLAYNQGNWSSPEEAARTLSALRQVLGGPAPEAVAEP